MIVIEPGYKLLHEINGEEMLRRIEKIGRVCYKSEGKITDTSYLGFISRIIRSGHESVIEHESVSVKIICDRGVSHEIVRHRIASYSQESTRYCNYSQDRFGNELTFIKPCFWEPDSEAFKIWKETMEEIERQYFALLAKKVSPQEARSVLPNSLKTEIVVTMNLREWRHFFHLRTSQAAHPQMQEVARALLADFKRKIPIVFDDIPMGQS